MKIHRRPLQRGPRPRGFTLIELLVVIAIISILAALTMGTFAYAQQASSRNRTTAGLSAIINALEQYKEKFGEYPEPTNPSAQGTGSSAAYRTGGAMMLYQAITGDGYDSIKDADKAGSKGSPTSDGKVDPAERPNSIRGDLPKTMVLNTADGYMLVDGFGHPYQYDRPSSDPNVPSNSVNVTFDVWSFAQKEGGDVSLATKKDPLKTGVWIKNW